MYYRCLQYYRSEFCASAQTSLLIIPESTR